MIVFGADSRPGWTAKSGDALLSWHAKGRKLVIKLMGKKQQLHGLSSAFVVPSTFPFPSFCQRSVSTHSQCLFLVKAPPPSLPPSIPIQSAITAPLFVPKWTFPGAPKGYFRDGVQGPRLSPRCFFRSQSWYGHLRYYP